jgi:hypothetical protein
MPAGMLTRRAALRGAAGVAVGVAGAGTPQVAFAHDHGHRRRPVPPEPIPGGLPISETEVIHVWAPGPTDVVLPFTGTPLQGFDAEPTTIRDFDGLSMVAFHVGTATGGDGTLYDLETDVRAFRGTYRDATGKRHFATFGFV